MPEAKCLQFESFRLDLSDERLWHGPEVIALTRRAFTVLCYLVEHAGQLVTRDDLFESVWETPHVSEDALNACIREIRRAFGDQARSPKFIETVRGRGYRFLPTVTPMGQAPELDASHDVTALTDGGRPGLPSLPSLMVSREAEFSVLQARFDQALRGESQVVFVTGEAGIGKTTLVDAFVTQAISGAAVWVGHGQCIEHYGTGEAYLPLLDALGQLCRGVDGPQFMTLLGQHAPSWLLQMPALLTTPEYEDLRRRSSGATQERMLRELAEAVEALTAEHPLALVLEDLHWSDYATIGWLDFMARRRTTARLLALSTFRPADAIARAHPVRTVTLELKRQMRCVELMLHYLPPEGVAAYLSQRLGATQMPDDFVQMLHERTNGNPFFLVTVVDEMLRRGELGQHMEAPTYPQEMAAEDAGVPESIRHLIEQQLAHISPEDQTLLEVASVAGKEFTTEAIAASAAHDVEMLEAQYTAWARQGQFLRACGTDSWPDGTVSTRFAFIHDLYREHLYERIPTSRRARYHQQIGVRLETGYGARAKEMAAELAEHFVRGQVPQRAIDYLRTAAETARMRNAHHEAISHLSQGLELVPFLPDQPERAQLELDLQLNLASSLNATKGYAAPEVVQAYDRARALCHQVGETPQLFRALLGLEVYYSARAELATARTLADQAMRLMQQREPSVPQRLRMAITLGLLAFHNGDFVTARSHLDQYRTLSATLDRSPRPQLQDPGFVVLTYLSWVLTIMGYYTQARQCCDEALELAQHLQQPFSLVYANWCDLLFFQYRDSRATQERAEALSDLANEHKIPFFRAWAAGLCGWSLAMQEQADEGVTKMREGLEDFSRVGAVLGRPMMLAIQASAYGHIGLTEEGLELLDTALESITKNEENFWKAELYRIRGELFMQAKTVPMAFGTRPLEQLAEESLLQAIDTARYQGAKAFELQAAISLARLWQRQDRHADAYELLAPIYNWFTEGFDTTFLIQAKTLLNELNH